VAAEEACWAASGKNREKKKIVKSKEVLIQTIRRVVLELEQGRFSNLRRLMLQTLILFNISGKKVEEAILEAWVNRDSGGVSHEFARAGQKNRPGGPGGGQARKVN
jgi:hypothetical protein